MCLPHACECVYACLRAQSVYVIDVCESVYVCVCARACAQAVIFYEHSPEALFECIRHASSKTNLPDKVARQTIMQQDKPAR